MNKAKECVFVFCDMSLLLSSLCETVAVAICLNMHQDI